MSNTTAQSKPGSNQTKIAVVYLARQAEGTDPLRKFAGSYLRHPAGVAHDLVVVYKGYERSADLGAARQVLGTLPHIDIEVSDEGFDIGAYLEASNRLDHEYVCFTNTFTEISADDWLRHLYRYASSPAVGIVGAMGSFESLSTSVAIIHKILWLCNDVSVKYDERLNYYYDFIIADNCVVWKTRGEGKGRLNRAAFVAKLRALLWRWRGSGSLLEVVRPAPRVDSYDERFKRWSYLIGPRGRLSEYAQFPPFPNPHIRSNGFMISRARLLGLGFEQPRTKIDACAFESGANSLTAMVRRSGLAAVVVGRNGAGYSVPEWPKSGTFRSGGQENLLMTDNQSRKFEGMMTGTRLTHTRMTWGDYYADAPEDFPGLGFDFRIRPEVAGEASPSPSNVN